MSKRLSILIPTLRSRAALLERLMAALKPQLNDSVEVLTELDSGEAAIGWKRNILVARSSAEYLAFIDDDDLVAEDYIPLVLAAIETKPDVVGFKGLMILNGDYTAARRFHHSIQNRTWFDKDGAFYRTPNHLNPVRRELAVDTPFPPMLSFGEDRAYSDDLRPKLNTEVMIEDHPIYLYEYVPKKPGRQIGQPAPAVGRRLMPRIGHK
jgi:glycosyltransferase involved in cell wall biosynthesis